MDISTATGRPVPCPRTACRSPSPYGGPSVKGALPRKCNESGDDCDHWDRWDGPSGPRAESGRHPYVRRARWGRADAPSPSHSAQRSIAHVALARTLQKVEHFPTPCLAGRAAELSVRGGGEASTSDNGVEPRTGGGTGARHHRGGSCRGSRQGPPRHVWPYGLMASATFVQVLRICAFRPIGESRGGD